MGMKGGEGFLNQQQFVLPPKGLCANPRQLQLRLRPCYGCDDPLAQPEGRLPLRGLRPHQGLRHQDDQEDQVSQALQTQGPQELAILLDSIYTAAI